MAYKIKKLEWLESQYQVEPGWVDLVWSCPVHILDRYSIVQEHSQGNYIPIWDCCPSEGYETLEEAKEAAQRHFEDQVLRFLEET